MGQAEKRLRRARKKRRGIARQFELLETGQVSLTRVLGDPPDILKNTDAYNIVVRAHHMGPIGARKLFTDADVWPHTRLGILTSEERHRLIDALPPRARF